MLSSHTNRRPMTRLDRFGSLSVLVLASIVVAGLQVGPVSASRSAESTGNAVEQEPRAEPSSERLAALHAAAGGCRRRGRGGISFRRIDRQRGGCRRRGRGGISFRRIDRQRGGAGAAG